MTPPGMCACGLPLHYLKESSRKQVEYFIKTEGEDIIVSTLLGSWMVPRHYIALHGLRASELPELAKLYSFEKVDKKKGKRQ